jgi:broad specificity phosphatase PhoE
VTRLLLVRHGQSEWNALGKWQGQANPPLTDIGREQARQAGSALGQFDAIFSSDLQRASETAVIISEILGIGPVVTDSDLQERCAGPWQGLTREEIEEGWPGALISGDRPEGYELDHQVLTRVMGALNRITDKANNYENILVVTHGGVIYSIEGSDAIPMVRIPNLGGRWISFNEGEVELGKRVDLVGDGTTPDLL